MRVLRRRTYRGPHLHSAHPMVTFEIDLEDYETRPTSELTTFVDELIAALPGLARHGCSRGKPGGFVERLREGTWLGHVAEHIALELQFMTGTQVSRGKTRSVPGHPGVYRVMVAYEDEAVGLMACRIALDLMSQLLGKEIDGREILHRAVASTSSDGDVPGIGALRALTARRSLGPTTRSIVDEAKRRGIPVERLDEFSLLRLGHGAEQELVRASITGNTSHLAVETAGNKAFTKALLAAASIPVPQGRVVTTVTQALEAARELGGPVVVKPLDGNHGRAVTVGATSPEDIRLAFVEAQSINRRVIVEEAFEGRDYRVLVVDGNVIAVAERVPARVIGDGSSTVVQLIAELNTDPRRGTGHEKPMTTIEIDAKLEQLLAGQGLSLGAVPEEGRIVRLRDTANISTGGEAIDRTDDIHPTNRALAEHAAHIIGLDVAGLDIITTDIARSVYDDGGGIVEVNAAPGFRMHLQPSAGIPRDVAGPMLEMLIPAGSRARIPIIAVTGTNGKTTVARMIHHILSSQGNTVGLTTTTGIMIGDRFTKKADASGPKSARTVLADPRVDIAVLETARGGILREGLAYERADVGIVMNVTADHVGLGGIETLEELAAVKSVVTRQVHHEGTSILNFDDPLVKHMQQSAGGRVAFFTLMGDEALTPELIGFLRQGGLVATVTSGESSQIVIYDGTERHEITRVSSMPATLGGAAVFNVQNALAAALAAYVQQVPISTIARGLITFTSSFDQNPGRLNFTNAPGCTTILDYAHNPAALTAFGDLLTGMRDDYRKLIGTVSIPGDRRDEDIRAMGRISANIFDIIIFRERPDGRGRGPGEVLELLTEGALAAGCDPDRVHNILDEYDAIDFALGIAETDDLVAVMPTDVEGSWEHILSYQSRRDGKSKNDAVDPGRSPAGVQS